MSKAKNIKNKDSVISNMKAWENMFFKNKGRYSH